MKIKVVLTIAAVVVLLGVSLFVITNPSNELSIRDDSAGLNGSFEIADSGYPVNWAFGPHPEADNIYQIEVDSTIVQDGQQSLKLTTDQQERTVGFRSQRIDVEPGKTYTISFAMQNNGCALEVNRLVQDASGTKNLRSDVIVETSTSTSEWSVFEETLTAVDREASLVLIFLVNGPGSIWFDDVRVEEISE